MGEESTLRHKSVFCFLVDSSPHAAAKSSTRDARASARLRFYIWRFKRVMPLAGSRNDKAFFLSSKLGGDKGITGLYRVEIFFFSRGASNYWDRCFKCCMRLSFTLGFYGTYLLIYENFFSKQLVLVSYKLSNNLFTKFWKFNEKIFIVHNSL